MHLYHLVHTVLRQFVLAPDGEHGVVHWARVLQNGTRLAARTGADLRVVQLFAILHDACRQSDLDDPDHGQRGAQFAASLRGEAFDLPDHAFALLSTACTYHTDGLIDADITVQTCWDADRLDLGRGGIIPDPRYLCTTAARNPHLIAWATERAYRDFVPTFVEHEWRIIVRSAQLAPDQAHEEAWQGSIHSTSASGGWHV